MVSGAPTAVVTFRSWGLAAVTWRSRTARAHGVVEIVIASTTVARSSPRAGVTPPPGFGAGRPAVHPPPACAPDTDQPTHWRFTRRVHPRAGGGIRERKLTRRKRSRTRSRRSTPQGRKCSTRRCTQRANGPKNWRNTRRRPARRRAPPRRRSKPRRRTSRKHRGSETGREHGSASLRACWAMNGAGSSASGKDARSGSASRPRRQSFRKRRRDTRRASQHTKRRWPATRPPMRSTSADSTIATVPRRGSPNSRRGSKSCTGGRENTVRRSDR